MFMDVHYVFLLCTVYFSFCLTNHFYRMECSDNTDVATDVIQGVVQLYVCGHVTTLEIFNNKPFQGNLVIFVR